MIHKRSTSLKLYSVLAIRSTTISLNIDLSSGKLYILKVEGSIPGVGDIGFGSDMAGWWAAS